MVSGGGELYLTIGRSYAEEEGSQSVERLRSPIGQIDGKCDEKCELPRDYHHWDTTQCI